MKINGVKRKWRIENSVKTLVSVSIFHFLLSPFAFSSPNLSRGMAAFEGRRWSEAMEAFIETLRQDPANSQAHAYIVLISREMESHRQAIVRAHRLQMLSEVSRHLAASQKESGHVQQAIFDTTQSAQDAREQKWRSLCEEARMERESDHLLNANDLVLQVLAENDTYPEAQRELSEIQSRIHHVLDSGTSSSIMERYALEGFYAYGQADYAAALTAWGKVHTLLAQNYSGVQGTQALADLHIATYEKVALQHAEEEKQLAELKMLFDNAMSLYQNKHFIPALDEFRKLAIRDPQYPQLGYYLVQAEAASEQERAERLGEEKRQTVERSIRSGLSALEKERLSEAEALFQKVLDIDPSHTQARSYLAMVRAELQKRHDPKAAQMHYEAGLIAYASGKLDEAMREWNTATRMNPRHEKAFNALAKVQKELALNSRELTDETLP